jgi:hypothetical protein
MGDTGGDAGVGVGGVGVGGEGGGGSVGGGEVEAARKKVVDLEAKLGKAKGPMKKRVQKQLDLAKDALGKLEA